MKPIELPILCHNEDTIVLKELELNYDYNDLTPVQFILFDINFASKYIKDGREYVEIISGDESFVADITWEEFKKAISIAVS